MLERVFLWEWLVLCCFLILALKRKLWSCTYHTWGLDTGSWCMSWPCPALWILTNTKYTAVSNCKNSGWVDWYWEKNMLHRPQLCLRASVWLQAAHFTSLCLSFLHTSSFSCPVSWTWKLLFLWEHSLCVYSMSGRHSAKNISCVNVKHNHLIWKEALWDILVLALRSSRKKKKKPS